MRVANDASVQGYGCVKGHGVELLLTFGTGMGSALFTDGKLLPRPRARPPSLEEDDLRGLPRPPRSRQVWQKRWNKDLREAIEQTRKLFNWDHLYLGGGNAKKIDLNLLPNVSIVSNKEGILGGVALWRQT